MQALKLFEASDSIFLAFVHVVCTKCYSSDVPNICCGLYKAVTWYFNAVLMYAGCSMLKWLIFPSVDGIVSVLMGQTQLFSVISADIGK